MSDRAAPPHEGGGWETRLLWLLVFILVGYWASGLIRQRVDPEIRRRVLQLLRERYPHHLIALQSAHLVENQAIVLDGLRIALPTESGPKDLLRIGRITARGRLTLLSLAAGQLPIESVSLDDCVASIWPLDADAKRSGQSPQWSLQTLSGPEPLPEQLPPLEVRSGIIKLFRSADADDELICHDLRARFRVNRVDPELAERPYELQAAVRSNHFQLFTIYGNISRDKSAWKARGRLERGVISGDLASQLPETLQNQMMHLSGFDGQISGGFVLAAAAGGGMNFEIDGAIDGGRLVHPRLPYPLEQLAGRLYCRNDLLQLREATARSGEASFRLNADVHGMSATVPIIVELRAENLPLDKRLYQVLPEKHRASWDRLQLGGVVDANVRLEFDGSRWEPKLLVRLRDAAVRFREFPYPLERLTGEVALDSRSVRASKLRGMAGGSPVDVSAIVERHPAALTYDVTVSCKQAVKIDDQLLAALSPRDSSTSSRERFVRSLRPGGLVHVRNARFTRDIEGPPRHAITLQFIGSTITFERFRYPIFDIQGEVQIEDSQINLVGLSGHNDSAQITCGGFARCDAGGIHAMQLDFAATSVPLEEELRQALPPGTRQLWDALQPSGVLDRIAVRLLLTEAASPLDIAVQIDEKGPDDRSNSRSVTLRPREIPYALSDVRCDIAYRDSVARINHISVRHDVSHGTAQGIFQVAQDGTWRGTVEWLPTTRLIVDQSLLSCLPQYLQQPILSTAFRGPVGIIGTTAFSSSADSGAVLMRSWDLQLAIEEGRLGWGEIASGIRGSMNIRGNYVGGQLTSAGTLLMDSMLVYGVPVLNLRGPFAIADSQVWLGRSSVGVLPEQAAQTSPNGYARPVSYARGESAAGTTFATGATVNRSGPAGSTQPRDPNFLRPADDPQLATHPDDITADCLGGTVRLHGRHEILSGRSTVEMHLHEADLSEALSDLSRDTQDVTGTLWGECSLQGALGNPQTFTGRGQAWLRRADLIQLPVMTRLFRALSVKDPAGGAFESGEVRFGIDGDRMPIEYFSLDGDIISLRGNGWTNLRRELQLDLYAYVGKRSVVAALLGPIVSQNDNASLLAVQVSGTFDAMTVQQSLPLMGANASQLFPEQTMER